MSTPGMFVELDEFTAADREALRDLNVREQARTESVLQEAPEGTYTVGYEKREMFTFHEPSLGTIRFDV